MKQLCKPIEKSTCKVVVFASKINFMKTFPATILTGILILGLTSCSSTLYESKWQPTPVVADGNPSEWSLPLRFYDSESGLQYSVTNNETTLFICIRATESDMQMRILRSGLNISLDPSGKNKKTSVLNFPLPMAGGKPVGDDMPEQEMKKPDNQGKKQTKAKSFLKEPDIELSGFAEGYNGTYKTGYQKEIKAAMNFDSQNALTLEFVIPFAALPSKNKIFESEKPVIGFRLEIASSNNPNAGNHEGGRMQGGPPPGGGSGGPGQGGGQPAGAGQNMGGAPPDGSRQQGDNETSATKIKFRIKLKNEMTQQ